MTPAASIPLVAADVGNTRIKLGLFHEYAAPNRPALPAGELPEPDRTLELPAGDWREADVAAWLGRDRATPHVWRIASVFRAASDRLARWVGDARREDAVHVLAQRELPIAIDLAEPDRVGIDRLLSAVAANAIRPTGRPAIVIDLGTAIKVHVVTTHGSFAGGAILPGIAMSARALNQQTDLLPALDLAHLDVPPPPLGVSTVTAIESGLYWGAVGAVRELATRIAESLPAPPLLVLTGGASPAVAQLLGEGVLCLPHLVLSGIALSPAAGER